VNALDRAAAESRDLPARAAGVTRRIRLGMLTPSCNTTLEPWTSAMVAGLPGVTAHFGRFRVQEISLTRRSDEQFEHEPMLAAARLLADARVDVIAWNGTSASWLGFDTDVRLCEQVTAETGIPATSAVLAINELLAAHRVRRFGLVSPYLDSVQARIVENYRQAGWACVAERHLGLDDGFAFAGFTPDELRLALREVAAARPDAVATMCTNMPFAPLVPEVEAETGVPVIDSLAAVVWKSLQLAGLDMRRFGGWGRWLAG
jgi:maleate isomerase